MLSIIVFSLLLLLDLAPGVVAHTVPIVNATWPNTFPKQIVANRRRQGLTYAEYDYHHTIVHGRKAWNAPDTVDQPLAYQQGHIFDSAYGINTTSNNAQPSFFGHNDITELYSRSADAFATRPSNNYTAIVIGPDGNAFADLSASLNMYAIEEFQHVNSTCRKQPWNTFNAFYWAFSNSSIANTDSFDNVTFASTVAASLLAALPAGTIYNASIHTSVPGMESRPYYGGYDNPAINGVLKFWLCDDNAAVVSFREAQKALIAQNEELGINLDSSFVAFSRAVTIYDRSRGVPFDDERAWRDLKRDQWRGDAPVPPCQNGY